jgi:1-acyl-sn-glycerol-3-phosphate acyltransferase
MIRARSIVYVVYLYLTMALLGLGFLPGVILIGRPAAACAAHLWALAALAGLRLICGTRAEVRGLEHLSSGPILIASKHQAMWETLFFMKLFTDPAIVLKKELLALPIYGWYARKLEMIAVDRDQGAGAIKALARQADKALADNRPIIIFPEGTRQPPGAPPDYKPGIALLYQRLGLPCVPAALNSGLYWAGQGIVRRPGKIVIEFLEPIPAGLDRKSFMAELESRIETASNRLLAEASQAEPQNRLKVVDA